VISGPGHHAPAQIGALRSLGWLHRAARQYPRFLIEGPGGESIAEARWFDLAQRAGWAALRRTPGLRRSEQLQYPFSLAYIHLALPAIEGSDLVLCWFQRSLEVLRAAEQRGVPRVLELPMNHIDAFLADVSEERRRWSISGPMFSAIPATLVHRMRRECQEAPAISVLSSYSRRTLLDHGVPASRVEVLPLGIDHERFVPAEGRAPGPLRLMFAGRVEALKGVAYLLQALALLPTADLEVFLVGPLMPEAPALLARFPDPRVRVITATSAEMPAWYRRADVFVFPTLNDSFGLVLLEAMASGLPVIASETSGAPDIVREGVDGVVIPRRDPAALAERIGYFLEQPGRAAEMGARARERVLSAYTQAHYREGLRALLAGAMQRQKPRSLALFCGRSRRGDTPFAPPRRAGVIHAAHEDRQLERQRVQVRPQAGLSRLAQAGGP
jgi:glycosyltransferase involved in cell wall biosynthesis